MAADRLGSDPAFLAAFGDTIRRARDEHGLDRKQLAAAAGISYSYLSAIESGQKLPSETVQVVLGEALGVSASELLARANGALASEPTIAGVPEAGQGFGSARASTAARHEAEAAFPHQVVAYRAMPAAPSPEPEITASGALAELRALIPSLSPEDASLLVSMARRLAAGESRRKQRAATPRRDGASAGRGLRTEAYLRFWTMYLAALETRGVEWGRGRTPEPRSYFTTPSPIRGSSLSASFARNRLLRHELYINRGSRTANLELLHDLESKRPLIEAAYGRRLDFEDPGRERRAVRIAEYREGHISLIDAFDDYVAWFIDRGIRMRRALEAYLSEG